MTATAARCLPAPPAAAAKNGQALASAVAVAAPVAPIDWLRCTRLSTDAQGRPQAEASLRITGRHGSRSLQLEQATVNGSSLNRKTSGVVVMRFTM